MSFLLQLAIYAICFSSVTPIKSAFQKTEERPNAVSAQHKTLQDQKERERLLITVIHVLIKQDELKGAQEVMLDALSAYKKALNAGTASVTLNHQVALGLLNVMSLQKNSLQVDIPSGLNIIDETDYILNAIQNHIATRNVGTVQKIVRSIVTPLKPYSNVLMIAAIPVAFCAGYGLWHLANKNCFSKKSGKVGASAKSTSPVEVQSKLDSDSLVATCNRLAETVQQLTKQQAKGEKTFKDKAFDKSSNLLYGALVVPGTALIWKYVDTDFMKDTVEKGSDYVKETWAKLQGKYFKGSNPASKSKVPWLDAPIPQQLRTHLDAIAHIAASQETVFNQGGSASIRRLLLTGDCSLAEQIGQGLAHRVTELMKKNQEQAPTCMFARIHVSKLVNKKLSDLVGQIKRYTESCVIILQDIDWVAGIDDETRTKITADILSEISSMTKADEPYVLIATAHDATLVPAVLRGQDRLALQYHIDLSADSKTAESCLIRAEKLYNVSICDQTVRNTLIAYLQQTSFGNLLQLFASAYAKTLVRDQKTLCAYMIEEELTLATQALTKQADASDDTATLTIAA